MGKTLAPAEEAGIHETPEAVLDARLKAMYEAMERPAATRLPDLGSLPTARRGENC